MSLQLLIVLSCCMTITSLKQPLNLDYQEISYYANNDTIRIKVAFLGEYTRFRILFTTQEQITINDYSQHSITGYVNSKTIDINCNDLPILPMHPTYFSVIAMENNSVSSDLNSQEKFYRFERKGIPIWEVPLSSVVKVPIPSTPCPLYFFRWPKYREYNGEHCTCVPAETSLHSFQQCGERCGTDYDIVLEDDSITFRNFNSSNILVHFFCEEVPCVMHYCLLESFIASYQLQTPSAAGYSNNERYKISTIVLSSLLSVENFVLVLLYFICICVKKRFTHKHTAELV